MVKDSVAFRRGWNQNSSHKGAQHCDIESDWTRLTPSRLPTRRRPGFSGTLRFSRVGIRHVMQCWMLVAFLAAWDNTETLRCLEPRVRAVWLAHSKTTLVNLNPSLARDPLLRWRQDNCVEMILRSLATELKTWYYDEESSFINWWVKIRMKIMSCNWNFSVIPISRAIASQINNVIGKHAPGAGKVIVSSHICHCAISVWDKWSAEDWER